MCKINIDNIKWFENDMSFITHTKQNKSQQLYTIGNIFPEYIDNVTTVKSKITITRYLRNFIDIILFLKFKLLYIITPIINYYIYIIITHKIN